MWGIGITLIKSGGKFLLGAQGEKMVTEVLSKFPDDWHIFNDVIIKDSQIDHIVICSKGVYTIETKHYNCKSHIYGNAEHPKWVQIIYGHKTPFYNPVKQGNKHSLVLSKYLEEKGVGRIWVNTIVVIAGGADIKVFSPKVPVVNLDGLEGFLIEQKDVLNSEECTNIVNLIGGQPSRGGHPIQGTPYRVRILFNIKKSMKVMGSILRWILRWRIGPAVIVIIIVVIVAVFLQCLKGIYHIIVK